MMITGNAAPNESTGDKLKRFAPSLVFGGITAAAASAFTATLIYRNEIQENAITIAASVKDYAVEHSLVGQTPSDTYQLVVNQLGDFHPAQIAAWDFAGLIHAPLNAVSAEYISSLSNSLGALHISGQSSGSPAFHGISDLVRPENIYPSGLFETIKSGVIESVSSSVANVSAATQSVGNYYREGYLNTQNFVTDGIDSLKSMASNVIDAGNALHAKASSFLAESISTITSFGQEALSSAMNSTLGQSLHNGADLIANTGFNGDYSAMGLAAGSALLLAGLLNKRPQVIPGTKAFQVARAAKPDVKNVNPKEQLARWNEKINAMRERKEVVNARNEMNGTIARKLMG